MGAGCYALAAEPSRPPIPFASDSDIPARNTVIELNPSPGGHKYQVQIRPFGKIWGAPYTFDITEQEGRLILKIRLSPGKYSLRTRTIDAEDFFGNWSSWQNFDIQYQPPQNVYPADGDSIRPKSGMKEAITFEWPELTGANAYLFILKDAEGNVIARKKTAHTWMLQEVDLSSAYSWTVVPLKSLKESDSALLETQVNDLTYYKFRVQGPAPGTKDVVITIKENPRAVKYRFEFLKLDRKGERGASSIYDSTEKSFKLTLAPGTYEVRLRTFFDDGSVSDWSPPWPFYVPYQKVKTKLPKQGQVFDPNDDINSTVRFAWEPQPDVTFYTVYVYDKDGKFVRSFNTEKTEITVGLPHNQTYRWLVIPYSANQSELKPPEMPEYAPEFRIARYIPLLLSSSEEPSHLYAWGRYWTSMIDYQGKNYDLNSLVKQPIYGGTGELAVGYWHRKTRFGLLAHGELSGFLLDKVYNYAGGGIDVGYRHVYEGGARLRLWVGYALMEFPEVLRDPYLKNYDYHRIRNSGPRLQISYMDDFAERPRYGWHVYGIVYRGTDDLGTPNRLPQVPQYSYTLGIAGTYKYSDNQKWMAGYSYKQENVVYKSSDRTRIDNSSLIQGHYLNLTIEWGLTDHYK